MTSEIQKPSYLHAASPVAIRKRPRVHPFKFSGDGRNVQTDTRNVYLRIKPKTENKSAFVTLDHQTVAVVPSNTSKNQKGISQQYKFTKIFEPNCQQEEIFKETCISPLNKFLHGGNCLVFAYGATNAGKTYTMQGSPGNPGIIPRSLNLFFNSIKERISKEIKFKPDKINNVLWLTPDDIEKELEVKQSILNFNVDKNKVSRCASAMSLNSESSQLSSNTDSSVIGSYFHSMKTNLDDQTIELDEDPCNVYSVWVSYAEIYNENIYDLLQSSKPLKPLPMGVNSLKEVYVKGLTDVCVFSAEEAFKVFLYGRHNLHQAATSINHVSSRSHSIFSVKLVRHLKTDCPAFARLSMCTFVDLAGAERAKKTKNAGERMKESQSINTSLHVLGKCFDILRHNQRGRETGTRMLPCRESKLTRLFQRALEGREVLTMIVNINQEETLFDETLNVLKFSAIAMELEFDRHKDSTFCSLRKSSFSLYMDKVSSTQSCMEDIEEVPEDARYMKLLAYTEELKKNLKEEKKRNVAAETQIRKEAYAHFRKIMENMEKMYNERYKDQMMVYAESEERTRHLMQEYLKNAKRRKVSDSEDENEDKDEEDESEDEDYEEKILFLENKVEDLTALVEDGEQRKLASNLLQEKYSKLQCELAMVKEELKSALKLQEAMGQGENSHDLVVKELNEQLAKTKEMLNERNSEIEVLTKLVEDAKAEYKEHFHEHEDFAAQNAELEKMLADREMKIDDLQTQLEICNKKLIQQQQCVNVKESEEAEYANKVQKACEARDEYKFKVLQLECDLKKLQKENETLKNQSMSSSNNEVKSLELLVASHEDQLKKYEEVLKNQEKENEVLKEEVSVLKSQSVCSNSDSYEKEISILQSEIKETIQSKKDLTDNLQKMTKELKETTEALTVAEAVLIEEQNSTKSMRRICESEKCSVVEELQNARDAQKCLEVKYNRLSSENNDLKLQIKELEELSQIKEYQMEDLKSRRNTQFDLYEKLLKHERELRIRMQKEVEEKQKNMRIHTPKKDKYLVSKLTKEKQSGCMEDVSNKPNDTSHILPKKLRNMNPRTCKSQSENVSQSSEDEFTDFWSPKIPIKPDPDSRKLRPRRKKVLYVGEDSKNDIGLLETKNTRRRQM